MLPYFALQVSAPVTPSPRSTPRGNFQRLVSRSMWKSMFLPTITEPLASGHRTRVHIWVRRPFEEWFTIRVRGLPDQAVEDSASEVRRFQPS